MLSFLLMISDINMSLLSYDCKSVINNTAKCVFA